MKVDKVLARFASHPDDEQELRRVARALGSELPRNRLDVLQRFRAELARVPLTDGSHASGYVAGMLDVTAEYEVFVRQSAEQEELARSAMREEWRAILAALAEGPRLPSDLAARLGKDRPSITRILKRLRTAGLVQAYAGDSLDGRRRPHRLTVQGQRLLDSLASQEAGVAADVERGIAIAVSLFRHMMSYESIPEPAMDAIAAGILRDPAEAARAVKLWIEQSKEAGLISEIAAVSTTDGQPHWKPETPAGVHDDATWNRIPSILTKLKKREQQDVPVYVRTSDAAWGAWAYALNSEDATGLSRTIVNGDILARSIAPPEQRFRLVYDDPRAIQADRDEPTMQAFWQRADEKFVVTSTGEDVPEGFIPLELAPEED